MASSTNRKGRLSLIRDFLDSSPTVDQCTSLSMCERVLDSCSRFRAYYLHVTRFHTHSVRLSRYETSIKNKIKELQK